MNLRLNVMLALNAVFHPVIAFDKVKEIRDTIKYKTILIILALITVSRFISVYGTHFPLSSFDPQNSDLIMELGILLIPLITWVIAAYAMTSILDGEVKFKELSMAAVLSMVPYIIFTVPITAISYLYDLNGKGIYDFIKGIVAIWVLILLFLNLKMLNGYTLGKAIRVTLLSLVSMAVIWFLAFILYSLTVQVIEFIRMITLEVRLKIW